MSSESIRQADTNRGRAEAQTQERLSEQNILLTGMQLQLETAAVAQIQMQKDQSLLQDQMRRDAQSLQKSSISILGATLRILSVVSQGLRSAREVTRLLKQMLDLYVSFTFGNRSHGLMDNAQGDDV